MAIVIDVSAVEIVYALIQGVPNHAHRFRFVDLWAVGISVCGGETHATKTQH
jgi:hypothetical protein